MHRQWRSGAGPTRPRALPCFFAPEVFMPVSTPRSTGVPPRAPHLPQGTRGPTPAAPATRPPVKPVATPGAASSSPPVEPHASNLTYAGARTAQRTAAQAPARAPGGRTGTPSELRRRFEEETSTFQDVSFDLSPPDGTSWADARTEFEQGYRAYQAASADRQFPQADDHPLPPTMRQRAGWAASASDERSPAMKSGAHPEGHTPDGSAAQGSSDTTATTHATRCAYAEVDFDLDNDPDLKKELLALNAKYAPPEAKASSAPPEQPRRDTAWKVGVFARKRSASQGDEPRPIPTGASKEAPVKSAPSKEGRLKQLLRWGSEFRVRAREPKK